MASCPASGDLFLLRRDLDHLLAQGDADLSVLADVDTVRVAPEALQLVVLPLLGVEDMDDEVQVIEEHPPGLPVALAAVRLHALGTKLLVDLLDDGPHLALVAPRTDHEVVGD